MGALRHIAFAILAAVVTGCWSEAPEEVPDAVIRPVKLVTVEEAGSGQSRRFPAVVEAASSSGAWDKSE